MNIMIDRKLSITVLPMPSTIKSKDTFKRVLSFNNVQIELASGQSQSKCL